MARTRKPKEGHFNVEQMIDYLDLLNQDIMIANSFFEATSHYSSPEDVAFVPMSEATTVGAIRSAVVATIYQQYPGWSNGLYIMNLQSLAWIAEEGEVGVPVTKQLMDKIFAKALQQS